ncbi:MAG: RNA methyltransferase [Planctomycetota bacterium]
MDVIRSSSHPLVKLARAAGRGQAPGRVLLEGERLIEEAQRRDWSLEAVLVSADRPASAGAVSGAGAPVRRVEAGLLARIGTLVSPPGVIGIAREPAPRALGSVPLDARALLVVVAGVQDPGNLGGLARTAEAAGAAALVLLPGGCGPWNTKALRGSMGSLLRLPVVRGASAAETASELAARGVRLVRAATRGGVPLPRFDWGGAVSLWITAESGALAGSEALEVPFEDVTIPMAAGVESLNVAAAAAILLFAAGRAGGREA